MLWIHLLVTAETAEERKKLIDIGISSFVEITLFALLLFLLLNPELIKHLVWI